MSVTRKVFLISFKSNSSLGSFNFDISKSFSNRNENFNNNNQNNNNSSKKSYSNFCTISGLSINGHKSVALQYLNTFLLLGTSMLNFNKTTTNNNNISLFLS